MNRRRSWLAIAGLGALFAVHVSSCSLIGLAAGWRMDAKRPRYEELRSSQLVRVAPGEHITLLLDDSTRVSGAYLGSAHIADSAYLAVYDAWRVRHPRGPAFPEIGEPVQLKPGGNGAFNAFVAEGVELQSRRLGRYSHENKGWLVRRDGSKLDLIEVRDLALSGELPLATALRIDTELGERSIPVNRIAMIGVNRARHAALKGFLVGLASDLLIVAVIASSLSSSGCGVSPNIELFRYSDRNPAPSPTRSARRPSPQHHASVLSAGR